MSLHADMRGGFPVAAFDTLPEAQQVLVRCLRLWSDRPHGAAEVAELLRVRMGEAAAGRCQQALDDVANILARHGRRRLVRHRAGCSCVGADEAVFAHFVMLAATGEREDAMLVGALMVEGPLLLPFAEAARQAGLYLYRAHSAAILRPGSAPGATVH